NGSGQFASIFLNKGDGTFGAQVDYPTSQGAHGVAIGDVDGDKKPDVVLVEDFGAVASLLNDGKGKFSVSESSSASKGGVIALSDMNGDGALDAIVTDVLGNAVQVLLNAGGGKFTGLPEHPIGTLPIALAVADVDGDGDGDPIVVGIETDNNA